jgi:hypothetical protein
VVRKRNNKEKRIKKRERDKKGYVYFKREKKGKKKR